MGGAYDLFSDYPSPLMPLVYVLLGMALECKLLCVPRISRATCIIQGIAQIGAILRSIIVAEHQSLDQAKQQTVHGVIVP